MRPKLLCATAILIPFWSGEALAQGAYAEQGQEIVVTAQRREERAQDVPISLTAFSPQRLQQQNITQAQDLQASVPSLVVGNNGASNREAQVLTIRGQGSTYQASPGVVVYLNEVPLPAAISANQQGGPGNFVDLENLQVLNGPQGTLFGRNTTGGAVHLVPDPGRRAPHHLTESGPPAGRAGHPSVRTWRLRMETKIVESDP